MNVDYFRIVKFDIEFEIDMGVSNNYRDKQRLYYRIDLFFSYIQLRVLRIFLKGNRKLMIELNC